MKVKTADLLPSPGLSQSRDGEIESSVSLVLYPGALLSWKIGSMSASAMPPTTPPMTVIIKGSIRLVSVLSEVSTS